MEVIERTITGAEVVHEQGYAEPAKASEDVERRVDVGNQAGFGHLQAKLSA